MEKVLRPWFLAIRPKTLPAGAAPVLLGLAYAYHEGHFNSKIALLTLICALLLQIASNLGNDYFDGKKGIDDHNRLGPLRVTQSGLIQPQSVKKGFILVCLIAFAIGVYLSYFGGFLIFTIGLVSLLFVYLYSGGPKPLSHLGLGELLAFLFYGLIAVFGTYYLQENVLSKDIFYLGMGPGFISAAILSINNIRDRESDLSKGKITLAVILGEKLGRLLPIVLMMLSLITPYYFFSQTNALGFQLALFAPFPFFKMVKGILTDPLSPKFNDYLAMMGQYLLLYSLLITLGFLLK